ncbi:spindle and kinetochore-associated protein 1 [Carex littledalei]|uniref:SKA complex subunit 1 homolog n=1 Tax=Carex littledalei TaxID=544730 RepID=A0A833VDR6_9POAL|nr:spindle and kinetochore-associated protein 1 [Carex littledalei]
MNPAKETGASLDALVSAFNSRIVELQELVIARNMYAPTSVPDLASVDTTLTAMESQIDAIKNRLYEERRAIPKAKKLIEQSEKQQKKLEHMLTHVPLGMQESLSLTDPYHSSKFDDVLDSTSTPGVYKLNIQASESKSRIKEDPTAPPKFEKRGKGPAPRWYISSEELDSVSSYMRGRLTLEKVNIAINELATYADSNAHLIFCSKTKVPENMWEKVLELRDIGGTEQVKGKHFFLESDIKGPGLKLDNTGKAILTVLRHLGRIQETRVGSHRVLILVKPRVH